MKYRFVHLIHTNLGEVPVIYEVPVIPSVLNEDQYKALCDFASNHDEVIVIECSEDREE